MMDDLEYGAEPQLAVALTVCAGDDVDILVLVDQPEWDRDIFDDDFGSAFAAELGVADNGETNAALGVGVIASAVAGVGGWAAGRHSRVAAGAPAPDEAPPSVDHDRARLRDVIREVMELVPSQALRDRLLAALGEAGVTLGGAAVGEPYDPDRHVATSAEETDDPELDQRIARVDRPGLLDRGELVQLPEVRVYLARTTG